MSYGHIATAIWNRSKRRHSLTLFRNMSLGGQLELFIYLWDCYTSAEKYVRGMGDFNLSFIREAALSRDTVMEPSVAAFRLSVWHTSLGNVRIRRPKIRCGTSDLSMANLLPEITKAMPDQAEDLSDLEIFAEIFQSGRRCGLNSCMARRFFRSNADRAEGLPR